jgi:hypothetical protein
MIEEKAFSSEFVSVTADSISSRYTSSRGTISARESDIGRDSIADKPNMNSKTSNFQNGQYSEPRRT